MRTLTQGILALCLLAAGLPGAEPAADDIQALRRQIDEQRAQIQQLQKQLEAQSSLLDRLAQSAPVGQRPAAAVAPSQTAPQEASAAAESPLQLRIGSTAITPVGFMDFTAVFRSTNAGTGIGTNFGSVPYSTTAAGMLTETRLSAQNSRIGIRLDAKAKGANVLGYLEADFLGPVPGNVSVTSNTDPLRLRVYWVDVRKNKWEFLAGQSWSMLTPNRKGLSALPADIFYSQVIDTNYQNGLVWSRDPQFRIIHHPNEQVAIGLSLENPEQYIGGSGGGGLVTLPAAFSGNNYSNQLDNGGTGVSVPNLHPDIVGKIAFDPKLPNGRGLHFEVAGLVRSFKLVNPLTRTSYTATGGGGSINVSYELLKNFRVLTNNYYSEGGGRWIFGLAPDLVVRADGSPSLVHSGSTVSGFEAQAKNTQFYGYYGGVYIGRNVVTDLVGGQPAPVGYGYGGSSNAQNRSIHEVTLGLSQTFWRDPKYGSLQLMAQYSYVLRHPWFVAPNAPGNAHTNMVFLNLRYALPGSAPTIRY